MKIVPSVVNSICFSAFFLFSHSLSVSAQDVSVPTLTDEKLDDQGQSIIRTYETPEEVFYHSIYIPGPIFEEAMTSDNPLDASYEYLYKFYYNAELPNRLYELANPGIYGSEYSEFNIAFDMSSDFRERRTRSYSFAVDLSDDIARGEDPPSFYSDIEISDHGDDSALNIIDSTPESSNEEGDQTHPSGDVEQSDVNFYSFLISALVIGGLFSFIFLIFRIRR